MISLQTYRFDNCHCAGRAKDSDEQQVARHRRKTTTKRRQRREHDQLPHPRVHLQDTFHFALYFGGAATVSHAACAQVRGLLQDVGMGLEAGGRSLVFRQEGDAVIDHVVGEAPAVGINAIENAYQR